MKQIPIENIYFLLCYAWDRLEEGRVVDVRPEGLTRLADLFARVLANGTKHLLKQGIDRDYQVRQESVAGVRGKVLLSPTIKRNLLSRAHTYCAFDELSHDVLHNQILKASLRALAAVDDVDRGLRSSLAGLYRRLGDVSDIRLTTQAFRSVQLHRNIRFYDFLLKVCRLVHESLMISEKTGETKFRDFTRDENAMPLLFQRFVFNFLQREQSVFRVSSPQLRWHGARGSEQDLQYLPVMQTDIHLESPEEAVVVDTKFYREAFQKNYGKERVRSDHLYQLFANLQNLSAIQPRTVNGMLLYPTVGKDFQLEYDLFGHRLRVSSINFEQPWQQVSRDLLSLFIPAAQLTPSH